MLANVLNILSGTMRERKKNGKVVLRDNRQAFRPITKNGRCHTNKSFTMTTVAPSRVARVYGRSRTRPPGPINRRRSLADLIRFVYFPLLCVARWIWFSTRFNNTIDTPPSPILRPVVIPFRHSSVSFRAYEPPCNSGQHVHILCACSALYSVITGLAGLNAFFFFFSFFSLMIFDVRFDGVLIKQYWRVRVTRINSAVFPGGFLVGSDGVVVLTDRWVD
jgi:hypothetical protein